ncbi:MAG: isochorismatase, partial [Leptolyngbyaceae cyanobacterium CAN_BIN12]|nr:isochorismatase [Leptolyngbyaceae cyanobacterium CAN_BIN12]
MTQAQLPIPTHFDPKTVKDVWRVPYGDRAAQAAQWAQQHNLQPAAEDTTRICLLAIDVQNTFCIPDFELFVGGQSGSGAV